jgi:hypothetical protein
VIVSVARAITSFDYASYTPISRGTYNAHKMGLKIVISIHHYLEVAALNSINTS